MPLIYHGLSKGTTLEPIYFLEPEKLHLQQSFLRWNIFSYIVKRHVQTNYINTDKAVFWIKGVENTKQTRQTNWRFMCFKNILEGDVAK